MKHIDTETQPVTITEPYVAGFLAFREVDHYRKVYQTLVTRHPEILDCHVVITDGNGLLHPHNFGLACHLGVLINVPTIGCSKNLHEYEGLAMGKKQLKQIMIADNLTEMNIVDQEGKVHGVAVRSVTNPIYISQGHMISLEDALKITKKVLIYREPEPIRLADRISREYLRKMICNK